MYTTAYKETFKDHKSVYNLNKNLNNISLKKYKDGVADYDTVLCHLPKYATAITTEPWHIMIYVITKTYHLFIVKLSLKIISNVSFECNNLYMALKKA